MSTPNPALVAAAPSLITVLQAAVQFNTDMGSNPAAWVANFPGAQMKFVGAVTLALPQLEVAEAGALQAEINSKLNGLIGKLQALLNPPAAATPAPPTGSAV